METDLSEGSTMQLPSVEDAWPVTKPVAGDSSDMISRPVAGGSSGVIAKPVPSGSSGEGLPYAPENWPRSGDVWTWKVGKRKAASGHWLDRYLFPPPRFRKDIKGAGFASKASVEDFLQKEFPETNVGAFFSSFGWRIPCSGGTVKTGRKKDACKSGKDITENSESESTALDGFCKARNMMCKIQKELQSKSLAAKNCNICCTEAGFCRDCCCILCCKTINWANGGYSFIRCEATVEDNLICGHVAHIECALRSYMAGTVGGSIGLDLEYCCRCCDNKTDLMLHVNNIVKICESLGSRDEIEQILNMGLCILRGSKQLRAKSLQNRIASAMAKLNQGVQVDKIWKMEESKSVPAAEMPNPGGEIMVLGLQHITQNRRVEDFMDTVESAQKHENNDGRAHWPPYITSENSSVSVKLEDEVDRVLQELKRSQEAEYKIAEQNLYSQKDHLLSLYRLLDSERSELTDPMPVHNGGSCDSILSDVLNRVDQIRNEEGRFRRMMIIAGGFGRTPRSILREQFGLTVDD